MLPARRVVVKFPSFLRKGFRPKADTPPESYSSTTGGTWLERQNPMSQILLVSDFPMLRESLQAQFGSASNVEVVGCANDQTDVLPLVETLQPELVLLDLNIAWQGVCDLLDEIHSISSARTLVMVDSLSNDRVIQALQHGAHGVVPRRTTPGLLIKSIQTVLAGEFWVGRGVVADLIHLFRKIASTPNGRTMLDAVAGGIDGNTAQGSPGRQATLAGSDEQAAPFGLTRRELQIIEVVVDGQTNKDIAATLGISEYTVKHHLTSIFDKLGVYNRVELVLYAINGGLFQRPIGL
jgi:DNA-binding NarL/FixJ family response regulator